jgi:hypothetical protein
MSKFTLKNPMTTMHALIAVPQTHCPAPPSDFIPVSRLAYRGTAPVVDELAVMQGSVAEIQRFEDYVGVFGRTAPSAPVVAQAFNAAAQWSNERRVAEAWLDYVMTQEGIAWKGTRSLLDDLKAAFTLAASRDGGLEATNPHLTRLFAVRAEIGKRAAATRARTKKAKAASNGSAKPAAKNVGEGTNGKTESVDAGSKENGGTIQPS